MNHSRHGGATETNRCRKLAGTVVGPGGCCAAAAALGLTTAGTRRRWQPGLAVTAIPGFRVTVTGSGRVWGGVAGRVGRCGSLVGAGMGRLVETFLQPERVFVWEE